MCRTDALAVELIGLVAVTGVEPVWEAYETSEMPFLNTALSGIPRSIRTSNSWFEAKWFVR